MEIKGTEILVKVQSCGSCDPSTAEPDPYRAALSLQFQKGSLDAANSKQISDAIGEVFKIDSSPTPTKDSTAVVVEKPPAVVQLRLPAVYVSAQSPADQLQLNADNSFSLQEAGQKYRGTFVVNGNSLEINIPDTNTKNTMTIQGSNLADPSGQTWALRESSAPTSSSEGALRNEDIIKMAKVGIDDATIIAKIESSKRQFDTSTDALIQLKQSGVSAPVLKAMVGAVISPPGAAPTVASVATVPVLPSGVPTPLTPADGSVFDNIPRKTTVSWTAISGAVEYRVEVDYSFSGVWAPENPGHPTPPRTYSSKSTSLSFNFVGAQPGRWRVSAIDGEGRRSEPSPWWNFRYTR